MGAASALFFKLVDSGYRFLLGVFVLGGQRPSQEVELSSAPAASSDKVSVSIGRLILDA